MRAMLGIYCTLVIFILSCSNSTEKAKKNTYLISWKSEFVMNDGEHATAYYEDRDNFIKPYINKVYSGDTLRAETLHEINSCAETVGEIKFSNDTLYLSTKIVGDEVCASVEFYKFSYTIVREDIKDYVIVF